MTPSSLVQPAANDRLRLLRLDAAEMHAGNVDRNLVPADVFGSRATRDRRRLNDIDQWCAQPLAERS